MCCIGCSNIFYGPLLLMVHKKNTSVNEVWSNRIPWKICWFLTWFINFLNKFVFIDLPLIQDLNKFRVRKWAGNITTDQSHHGQNLLSSFPLVGATEHCMPKQADNCTFFSHRLHLWHSQSVCTQNPPYLLMNQIMLSSYSTLIYSMILFQNVCALYSKYATRYHGKACSWHPGPLSPFHWVK